MTKSTVVPIYLEAKSKDDLIKAMFDNNTKLGRWNKYFNIQKDGKKWVCWYYQDIVVLQKINAASKDD